MKDEVAKSRLTVADYKGKDQRDDVFSPTPSKVALKLLELRALIRKEGILTGDVTCACPHVAETELVAIRPPSSWKDYVGRLITAGTWQGDPDILECSDYLLQLKANLYGRRAAGANCRRKFEQELKLCPNTEFERAPHEPCAYYCKKTEVLLIHHVDDVRVTGPQSELNRVMTYLEQVLDETRTLGDTRWTIW